MKGNKTYGSVLVEIGTKIYKGAERDRRDEPNTTSPIVGK